MSTRNEHPTRAPQGRRDIPRGSIFSTDPAEEVALVARARRELMLRVHRHRLRPEDLEDCYSQAALELVSRALKGARFSSRSHLANTLEQRFLARILDRRRALGGRSPMHAALETAVSIGEAGEQQIAIADARADVEKLVLLRHDLRHLGLVARELTADQRMVLAAQLAGMPRADFCSRFQWSEEKYRKVAQRARARLRQLMSADDQCVPSGGPASEQGDRGTCLVLAGLRLDTSHAGTDVGPNRYEDGPRWRILDRIPSWARWSVRHPPGL